MFERYTETARKVIFTARYEASQFGSGYIETEHLLLGILRTDGALALRLWKAPERIESVRQQIEKEAAARKKVPTSTSVDLPLSHECKRVLAYGAEEAERLNHKPITTVHLLLGLLREDKCFASKLLLESGLTPSQLKQEASQEAQGPPAKPAEPPALPEGARDLTAALGVRRAWLAAPAPPGSPPASVAMA